MQGGAKADRGASHKPVKIKKKFSLPPCPARERCPRGNLSSPPLSLLSAGEVQPCRAGVEEPALTEPSEWPCTANEEEGRVGERKGGREGRGGGGKAIGV